MEQTTHDVAVVGAGVAGTACALLAARQGLHVILIEKQPRNESLLRPDWLPSRARALLAGWKIDLGPLIGPPFKGATFHSTDLSKHTDTTETEPPAFRIDYSRLVGHLRDCARRTGVDLHHYPDAAAIACGEKSVRLTWADREPVEARFLVRADGTQQPAEAETGVWIAELHLAGLDASAPDRLHWILGLDRWRALASWWSDEARVVVRLAASGAPDELRQRLVTCANRAVSQRWLNGRPRIESSKVMLRAAPPTNALERESHVDKRTLWIGDAGGFVSTATREGIEPALRSAALAVETLVAAARHRTPQDVLQKYDVAWRSEMAEELGTPETHVLLLLPLVFRNTQMAQRLAGVFWYGRPA